MKFVSTMALGVALALGGAATVGLSPAIAQKADKNAPKPKSYNLSKAVRENVSKAQAANAKGDFATGLASALAAKAEAKTPDDQFVSNSVLYEAAAKSNDTAHIVEAVDGMLASGGVDPALQAQYYGLQGKLAYNAKDMAKAEAAFEQAVKLNTNDTEIYALLVEAKARANKPGEALALLESSIAKQHAAGQKPPTEWYGRGISIGYQAKLADETERLTQAWLADYPDTNNWRDALITYRDLHKVDSDYELDIMRLLRTAKALKGERDYYEYAEAVYLKYPGEGKSVIDEGVAAGAIKLTPGGNFQMMSAQSNSRVAADKADLAAAAKSAKAAANGRAAAATADSFIGYGDYASAIDLYNVALTKGGVDANVVNTRLGMALAKAGRKDEAKAAFAKITGPRASLAKYWTIYLDKMA
jgi:tetratricopeptide (TPR) repeat protein